MDTQKRLELIKQVGEEIVTEEELIQLLNQKKSFIAYDGFEPSGFAHLPFAIYRAINIQKMVEAGAVFKLWIADYHAMANNKFEGNLEMIQTCGNYFIEVWKAAGVPVEDKKKIQIEWASQKMDSLDYWHRVLEVGRNITLPRLTRALSIMGRKESENLHAAQLYYPCMQVADIFELDVDICQLGLDQRRANILAREVADKTGWKKPVAVHHHMLHSLQGVKEADPLESKMSKSKPESAIFVHDSVEVIQQKINKAYCPEKITENNPVLDYCKHMVFEKFSEMKIQRPEKFGGNLEIQSYLELEILFREGKLHPMDLKKSTGFYLNELIQPIREHFEKNKKAKELYEKLLQAKVTR
ncbi:MAG: tyrosine--tRNA ligase [Candidatus Diapherotrites archaeon]|nr:tyrosine--tRNA ligase [Candidatus Diapherotrites archaeon]